MFILMYLVYSLVPYSCVRGVGWGLARSHHLENFTNDFI